MQDRVEQKMLNRIHACLKNDDALQAVAIAVIVERN
jgi:hypothetical protein